MNTTDQPGQNYLVRCTDPRGVSCVERVQASGAQDAIDQLAERGFTNIRLESDDFHRMIPGGGGADQVNLSPRDLTRMKRLSPMGNRLFRLWIAYRSMPAPLLIAVGGFVARRIGGAPMGWLDAVLGVVLLAPLGIVLCVSTGLPELHRRIQREYL